MLKPVFLRQFEKEVDKVRKRGKDLNKLTFVVEKLIKQEKLPEKYRNHKLKGNFKDYWECHIEPDWLLVYKKTKTELVLVRTGSHADLF